MAGHSKFKNIQHRKNAQDKKRAKIFTRLVREIIGAAKSGGTDPALNPKLRTALNAARERNLPKDRIEKALERASDPSGGDNYSDVRYEGFAPNGVALIVEASTDNKNRTAAEIRAAFTKYGGNLGETGGVSFSFEKVGIISYPADIDSPEKLLEYSLESEALDIESDSEEHILYTPPEKLNECVDFFSKKYGTPEDYYQGWRAKNTIEVEKEEEISSILKLIELLEDNEDVKKVFSNLA